MFVAAGGVCLSLVLFYGSVVPGHLMCIFARDGSLVDYSKNFPTEEFAGL